MEKVCSLCGKQLAATIEYQFFPEDDSCICKDCLLKESKKDLSDFLWYKVTEQQGYY